MQFAFIVRSAECLSFIVGMFTLTERNLHLCKAFVVDKKAERDDGLTSILDLFLQFSEFFARHEEFAITFGFVVGITAKAVLGDVHLLYPQFVTHKLAIGIDQGSLALTNGFDLRSEELDTCGIALQHLIIEGSTAVFDIYVAFYEK